MEIHSQLNESLQHTDVLNILWSPISIRTFTYGSFTNSKSKNAFTRIGTMKRFFFQLLSVIRFDQKMIDFECLFLLLTCSGGCGWGRISDIRFLALRDGIIDRNSSLGCCVKGVHVYRENWVFALVDSGLLVIMWCGGCEL